MKVLSKYLFTQLVKMNFRNAGSCSSHLVFVFTFRNDNVQVRKSISFIGSGKGPQSKGYAGANQSRMGMSKTMILPPELKTAEKMNISGTKTVQVFDNDGVDVTPRPLYHPDPLTGTTKLSKLLTSQEGSLGSEFISSYSLYQNTLNPSVLGQFTRSVIGSSTISKSSVSTTESIAEVIEEPLYKQERLASFTDVRVMRVTPETILTKEDLEKDIEIMLTETETLRIFDLPTVMISIESEEAEKIVQRNKKYDTLCKNRAGNDLYVERMMQTFNGAPKHKDVQCDRVVMEDKGIMSTVWDLYDSYNALELLSSSTKQPSMETGRPGALPKDRDQRPPDSEASSLMDIENVILNKIPEDEEDHSEAILKSDRFHQDLFFMERVLMENVFQQKLAAYRQLPILKERKPEESKSFLESQEDEEEVEEDVKKEKEEELHREEPTIPANLERLWSFSCDVTKGLNVSSLAWNKANPDLLAVGYGHFGFKEQKRGLACCWSIKNPMWPERIYQSPFGVTALDFSIGAPNLLAVGYYNGTVAIYNVQSTVNIPVLDSSESPQKHLGPIWQLQWIEQDRGTTGEDKREILVSISADGRICKWVIRKGLDCHDLMRLKRTTAGSNKKGAEKEKKGEVALISRQAPGMCFAFHPKDTNIYLVGTEEGYIHKCSCSYNEQYLDTYRGHKGPVYKVTWNLFCPDVFLSCSADWGVLIWQQESTKPFLSFYPTTHVIYDVAWSPKSSYIFAAANESRVEIWDLHISTLDPLIVKVANPGIKFTTILFAKQTDCLLVGDSDGQVAVYELRNMPVALDSGRGDIINAVLGSKSNQPG
ncbi:dynein axonemal intermediate chain 4 isoform X2 [Nycticebus coucang]|uniref:dynein axonemal intermediate chain 4 isoform X2 n=2 Tax=Nycticebus coucang TaxID=9470 RepID=UPI00234DFBB2|nr:dynein axonemal intermediate chain 4 isoform X2 [Nycticebus coucang]